MAKNRTKLRRLIRLGLILILLGILSIVIINIFTIHSTKKRLFSDVNKIPSNSVGLLLGAREGNWYFNNRISAASVLYKHGKIKHIIVSGDNHIESYDEPNAMKKALIEQGVDASDITCDYAGFRTLDSVVRAKEVFQQQSLTIISQEFHNYRALMIADRHGIDAIAYSAQAIPWKYHKRTAYREYIARSLAFIDLYVINRQPKFLGKKETINL